MKNFRATTCSDETCQKEISEEELKNVDKIVSLYLTEAYDVKNV